MEKIREIEIYGGVQILYRAGNGWGASVVCHHYSRGYAAGLWELAVIKFDGDTFDLCYDTPIADDVIGRLTWDEVEGILAQIQELAVATQEV